MSLDPVVSGITLAALWAADVSTACTILLGAGTLISQDIYKRFINPQVTTAKFLASKSLVILLVGLATLWLAFKCSGNFKNL